jgi:uncharacterized membrane protein
VLALTPYLFLKFLHVLLAIVAVGANATYGVWLARAARDPEHTAYTLRSVKFIDDHIANPAYALLLVTGLSMVVVGHLDLTTFWIATALVLYVLAVLLGLFVFTPLFRRQVAALEAEGPMSEAYRSLAKRARLLGILVSLDVLAIIFLMVTKPTFD